MSTARKAASTGVPSEVVCDESVRARSFRCARPAAWRSNARLGADYEWGNHVIAATKLGMSKSEIRGLRDGDVGGFDENERVAIAFGEAVEDRTVDDALWEKASTWFTPAQLADLTMLVGFYGLASRFVMALGVPLDEGVAGLDSP